MCVGGAFGNSTRRVFRAISLSVIAACCVAALLIASSMRAQQDHASQGYGQPSLASRAPIGTPLQRKISEGEYEIYEQANGGAFGPFGEELYNFHETWTLWRSENGQYKVEGERKFESPRHAAHTNRFLVELSRDMTVVRITEFTNLKWERGSGPLTCDFLAKELHCSSGARGTRRSVDLHIPVEVPFGFLWPISPFSLTGLTRQSERDLARGTKVQLVSIEQPSAALPLNPMVLSGQLQYLGEENIKTAEQEWSAHKFSLKVALHPKFLIWTSSSGLLLALSIEHPHSNWQEEGMKLVHFTKWDNF